MPHQLCRGKPFWSLPLELFVMMARPSYLSAPGRPVAGLGAQGVAKAVNPTASEPPLPGVHRLELDHLEEPAERMRQIHIHVRRANRTPSQANFTECFMIPKGSKVVKRTPRSDPAFDHIQTTAKDPSTLLRVIHATCPWWRSFYRARYVKAAQPPTPPPWAWGGFPHRRREGATAIPRIVCWKARAAGLSCSVTSHDMRNAFCCGGHDERTRQIQETAHAADQPLFLQRRKQMVAHLQAHDRDQWLLFGTGGPMGCSNEPEWFMLDFYERVQAWIIDTWEISAPLVTRGPFGAPAVSLSTVAYIDDLLRVPSRRTTSRTGRRRTSPPC